MNTFGHKIRLTTFGESHGAAIGGVIDGFPAGMKIDFDLLEKRIGERRPGQPGTSSRREDDKPEILSGVSADGVTLGTPIAFLIKNKDRRPDDYNSLNDWFRPNHADYTYQAKYGIRDPRGGGRASARETACRVVAGTFAEQLLARYGITVDAWLSAAGGRKGSREELMEEVETARKEGDSIGGIVDCIINGVQAGLGEPLYDKLSARLAYAMMGINAAKGFEIGDGFELADKFGSDTIDEFRKDNDGKIMTLSNHSGGIQGGISNGMPITFRVAFKPTPTIAKPLPMIKGDGEVRTMEIKGRHDPCVAVRAVPVVRAMAALVIADFIALQMHTPV